MVELNELLSLSPSWNITLIVIALIVLIFGGMMKTLRKLLFIVGILIILFVVSSWIFNWPI